MQPDTLENDDQRVFTILERVLFLKEVELFRNVDTECLGVIAEIAREIACNTGDIIAREGDLGDSLYIIKQGSLKIIKEKEGKQYLLANHSEGKCFGELGLFGRTHRTAGAVANEKSVLLEIRKDEFKKVILTNPEIAYNMLEILSERIRRMDNEIILLTQTLGNDLVKDLKKA
ncbi:MAG: hypothetical protein A2487_06125 [Candidatus Raymondbacteria bacterium RifOxyC12_full_50_8]|uniref:Cyclic nucleotide-binding domain-containing protein n=1 Tax=Candidatus Raymondbacteria bacterium RIFOXYD12_FULL_49_13 TaxID=1817890 RepID=A0A1F7F9R8_UNCRA|nr:MAG: hypothetical protein A2248_18620 [Candidatus Raymondbacteria bacterium RIFOXYA2_FULL_49_16]OGJ98595.1 MAG: hypothetical protein A2350_14165 [Candidatus Raymondbacteria bacterium RifOxyB12_full_50_8]OGJ99479.1 MAG: hypothetical protein A2487_06125 [Candidatus Raymondbacteria bacterium RifOxyC12_full_50_8]OGK03267.1 MAG: hypothetical protein A2519_13145 [Candidatus Raymondbacteria bacterium RIFOXYD12_FULL_49_13]OGP41540.1 MAG: hypothetical protein A2324_09665 [Candidatus Raymondbacteria b